MSARHIAEVWLHNKQVVDEWLDDYTSRTGVTREDAIADRQSHWVHDPTAEVVCKIDGYKLSVCQLKTNMAWRYTVVTPWGMSEGLIDHEVRVDLYAVKKLREVIGLIN